MAKRPVKKAVKKVISEFGKHKCAHPGCKKPTCMMRRDRKTGKEIHYCGTHWVNDREKNPEFQKQLARFKKWQAELKTDQRDAKGNLIVKTKKKVVKKTARKKVSA